MSNNRKQKILVVTHSFLNDAVKVRGQNEHEFAEERIAKRAFIKKMLTDEVELIQLPAPDSIIYGVTRWAVTPTQLDTPYFRNACREMLMPVILQLKEFSRYPNRFELLGVVGTDGCPCNGVNYTYNGSWGGELCNNPYLEHTLNNLQKEQKPGILISVLKELLLEHALVMNIYSLETFPSKTSNSNYNFMDIKLREN